MSVRVEPQLPVSVTTVRDHHVAALALSHLPDDCALNLGELAERIGADKLELIEWTRADIQFARLVASKVTRRTP
jgi:hypothetical protein